MNSSTDILTLKINALICSIGLLKEKLIIYESKSKNSKESIECRKILFEKEKEYDKLMKTKNHYF